MRRKDTILLIVAILVLAFSLVKPGANKAVIIEATPSLIFVHNWEGREEMLNSLKEQFEIEHPDIMVVPVFKHYDEGDLLTGNNIEGDVIAIDPLWADALYMAGKIEPQNFPVLHFFYPLFYNIELLKEAGFSGPPKTTSEFLAQARAINKPEAGVHAIAFALGGQNLNPYRDIYSWIWAAGVTFFNTETQHPRPLPRGETEALRETFNFLVTLHDENLILPGTFNMAENEKRLAFLDGKTAFMIGSAQDMELLRAGLKDALDYTAIPAADNYQGKPIFGQGGWTLAINSNSALKEQSQLFISFLTEHSPSLAQGWAIPEDSNPIFSPNPFYSKAQELYVSGDLIQDFPFNGPHDMDMIFRKALVDLYEEKITATEAVQAVVNGLSR